MDNTEIDIRDVLGLLRRQLRLIVIVLFIALGIAAVALFATKPIYSATALVLVDPSNKNLLESTSRDAGSAAANSRIHSEVEIIRSDATLLRVIEAANLVAHEEFGVRLGLRQRVLTWLGLSSASLPTERTALRRVLNKLKSALSVRRKGDTYLIDIRFSSQSSDTAAEVANQVATSYIHAQLQAKIQGALAVRDILYTRITAASEDISATERALDTFIFANVERVSTETGNFKLSRLNADLISGERDRLNTQRLADVLTSSIQQQDWQTLAASLELDVIAELERQRQNLVKQVSEANEAEALDLRAALATIEQDLSVTADRELARLRSAVSATQATNLNLRQQIRISTLSSDLPADLITQIYQLQQNASVSRTQYQTLLSRLREVETQADLQIADSRIVSAALPPDAPGFPNNRLVLALAGMLGLGFGVGLAFLNERYIGGFTSAPQVEAVLRPAVVVGIPKQQKPPSNGDISPADAIKSAPLSAYSESMRRLRAGIDQSIRRRATGRQGEHKSGIIILVSSALANEGKSTTALALARTYAISGQRTLLIDTDMRRPAVHKLLGLEPSSGLFSHLTSASQPESLADSLASDYLTDLSVLLGAHQSDIATDQIFASSQFSVLIESAQKHFDIIVLDTSPAGPVVDALYLAQYADFLVFTVKWASTSQTDVRTALKLLSDAAPLGTETAIVLNQQSEAGSSQYSNYATNYAN